MNLLKTSLAILLLLLSLSTCKVSFRMYPSHNDSNFDEAPIKVSKEELKHLQGPPDEFQEHILPKPSDGAVRSDSALFSVLLKKVPNNKNLHSYEWKGSIPVDTEDHLTISLISKYTGLHLFVKKPGQNDYEEITDRTIGVGVVAENFAWGSYPLPTTTFAFQGQSLVKGIWSVIIKTTQQHELPVTNYDHVAILIDNLSPLQIQSHLTSYDQRVGEPVGLVTKIVIETNEKTKNLKRIPKFKTFDAVDMAVRSPNGRVSVVRMTNDDKSNERVFKASIIAEQSGSYLSQVQFSGETEDGTKFVRTSQHVFSIVKESLHLQNTASYTLDQDLMNIKWTISEKNGLRINGNKYKVYSEVWGEDGNGKKIPVAWIGGMSIVEQQNGAYVLPLQLNLKWISKTKSFIEKLELRNAYIQESRHSIPLAQVENIKLVSETKVSLMQYIRLMKSAQFNGEVTEDMLVGKRPEGLRRENRKSGNGVVVLSHGYCSSSVPFRSSDFTNFALFLDANANRLHDDFALRLLQFGRQFDQGFSIVAHSQGGMASLHLLSFYWSKQDLLVNFTKVSDTNRVVQSVGSPFNGNTMAGTIAGIGGSIGYGCGSNSDMALNGAQLWMATIPKSARSQVFFHYTQYKDWNWCHLAAQAVLKWPNDGTTENEFAVLKDGNNKGLKKGWCHVSGMNYENQCLDSDRNKEMNAKAAR